jgi:hypothetical protein
VNRKRRGALVSLQINQYSAPACTPLSSKYSTPCKCCHLIPRVLSPNSTYHYDGVLELQNFYKHPVHTINHTHKHKRTSTQCHVGSVERNWKHAETHTKIDIQRLPGMELAWDRNSCRVQNDLYTDPESVSNTWATQSTQYQVAEEQNDYDMLQSKKWSDWASMPTSLLAWNRKSCKVKAFFESFNIAEPPVDQLNTIHSRRRSH